jgi:hypothetical protein
MKRNPDSFLEKHPNLVSIECHQGEFNCLLVSMASLPPNLAGALAEPSVDKRSWWDSQQTKNLLTSTHLKTYEGNDEDVNPPLGHEHYLDLDIKVWNFRVLHPNP